MGQGATIWGSAGVPSQPKQPEGEPRCLLSRSLIDSVACSMTRHSQERLALVYQEILKEQPIALLFVLNLPRQGATGPILVHALHLLTVFHACFKRIGGATGRVTDGVLRASLENTLAMASFFREEPRLSERLRLIEVGIAGYPEPYLLEYWVTYSRDKLLPFHPHKKAGLVMAATKALLDSFVFVNRLH